MKTKRGLIAVATLLFMATPFFGAMAQATPIKPHKVLLKNLTVNSIDTTAKTITAHSATNINYTISYSTKTKFMRASGEKFKLSGFLSGFFEFMQNDSITVWGTTVDDTNINASKIRNNSTRKIKGLYLGTIGELAPESAPSPYSWRGEFVAVRGTNQMLLTFTYGNTKFKFGKKKSTYAALQVGDVVAIQGVLRTMDTFTLIYNTTQVVVKRHGTAPTFPLSPSFLKVIQ